MTMRQCMSDAMRYESRSGYTSIREHSALCSNLVVYRENAQQLSQAPCLHQLVSRSCPVISSGSATRCSPATNPSVSIQAQHTGMMHSSRPHDRLKRSQLLCGMHCLLQYIVQICVNCPESIDMLFF